MIALSPYTAPFARPPPHAIVGSSAYLASEKARKKARKHERAARLQRERTQRRLLLQRRGAEKKGAELERHAKRSIDSAADDAASAMNDDQGYDDLESGF